MDNLPQLAIYLDGMRWSAERLARDISWRHGAGTVSAESPYGWLKGSYPRGRIPEVVAEMLAEQLDETIDVRSTWPPKPAVKHETRRDLGLPWSPTSLGQDLRWLVDRAASAVPVAYRPVPGHTLVSLAVDWLTPNAAPARAKTGGEEVNPDAIVVLTCRVRQFRGLDSGEGGMLADWIVHDLSWAVWLAHDAAYGSATGMLLYTATAELARLAGWIFADRSQQAQGQHCLLAALHAARVEGDRLGEKMACQRALVEATTPPWSQWGTPAALEANAGRARLDLGQLTDDSRPTCSKLALARSCANR